MIRFIDILNEDLRAWFGKGKQGGIGGGGWDRYNSSGDRVGKCGDAKEGDPYSACLSKEKAKKLGKDGRAAFVKRKRDAQSKGGDAKKGGERSSGQKPIKVTTGANEAIVGDRIDCDKCDHSWPIITGGKQPYLCHECGHDNTPQLGHQSDNFFQKFQQETGISGEFDYIGLKNKEHIYTMPVEDLGDMDVVIANAVIMARISDDQAYFGIIYTLNGLEQFDATIVLLKRTFDGIVAKKFDDADPEFSDSKTKFLSLYKNMVTEGKLYLFLEKNSPTDASKWSYYKSQAKKKFDVYPSAYANAWAAKMYKKAGGGWRKEK